MRHRFLVLELSLDVIRCLRKPLRKLRTRRRKLHDQIDDALGSITMNLSEGNRRVGKDRLYLFHVAAGSAGEAYDGLRVAEAAGHLQERDVAEGLELLDRVLRMIWGLTH